jgi:lipooligosaccharide transport system ATP-binding protein
MPEHPSMPLIHARDLTKRFGTFTAVDSIDFDVARGESFGFLGPNGAGKTSTMRMIGSVSPITAGTLRVMGMDPETEGPQIRARVGVVPQQDTLDNELTVRENLVIYGRYFGLARAEIGRRADELLEFAQLSERA